MPFTYPQRTTPPRYVQCSKTQGRDACPFIKDPVHVATASTSLDPETPGYEILLSIHIHYLIVVQSGSITRKTTISFTPRQRAPGPRPTWGWAGSRTCLDVLWREGEEFCTCQESNSIPRLWSPQSRHSADGPPRPPNSGNTMQQCRRDCCRKQALVGTILPRFLNASVSNVQSLFFSRPWELTTSKPNVSEHYTRPYESCSWSEPLVT